MTAEVTGFLEISKDATPRDIAELREWWEAGGFRWAVDDGSGELLADGAKIRLPSGETAIFHRVRPSVDPEP